MATITYRGPGAWGSGYGSALTILQVDTNFYNLNENKLEKGDNLSGLTNKSTARTNLGLGGLPAVTSSGSSNQYLRGDGSWGIPPTNPGTVTRVQGTGTVAGITLTGDFNSSGYLTLGGTLSVSLTSNVFGILQIANGGTGATTAPGALSNIGAAASVHGHSASDINSGQLSISRMPRGTSGYLLQASGTSADPAWVATSGISVNYATSAGSATSASSATTAGSCSGNAATATKLLAARSINGTSFDGSANITTANWGTSRTITIGSTGKPVNGSANVSWSLSDIGAAASSHSHDNYITNSGSSNHTDGTLEFRSNNAYQPQLLLNNFSADTSGPYLIMGSARGTRTAPSATLNGDNLGVVFYAGYIDSTYPSVNGAAINCKVTGPATSNKFPAALEFQTVNDSGVFGTRMTIGSDMLVQMHTGIKTAFSRSGFGQTNGTFQVTDFIGSQASPGGTGIYFKNNSSNVAGMLYAAQAACGLVSDNGLTYGAPGHTWSVNKVQEMFLDSGFLRPYTNNGLALGASDSRWNIAYITNGVSTESDARSKKDIVESNLGLDFILRLNPVSYKWKEDSSKAPAELVDRTNFGFIAQEVEESLEGQDFGGLMYDSQTDRYGLRYEQFIAPLTKAIQEQQEIINNLKARIEALEAK